MANKLVCQNVLLLLFILLSVSHSSGQSLAWDWGHTDGYKYFEVQTSSTIDSDGSLLTVGYFQDSTWQGDSLFVSSQNSNSGYIAKYDAAGTFQWAVQPGKPDTSSGGYCLSYGIATDPSNNVFVCGYFGYSVYFGDSMLTSSSGNDQYLAKYDASGNFMWVRTIPSTHSGQSRYLATDANGNVYMCGDFKETATFGNISFTSKGSDDLFLSKYSPNGDVLWVVSAGDSLEDRAYGVTLDSYGDIYITGYFEGSVSFGSTTLTTNGPMDAFVAKYNEEGSLLWVKQIGGASTASWTDTGDYIKTNNFELVISGTFRDTLCFGGDTIISSEGTQPDVFIAAMDLSGSELWAAHINPALNDWTVPITVDSCAIYAAGQMNDTVMVGDSMLLPALYDFYIVKYNLAGNIDWIEQVSDTSMGWFGPIEIINIPGTDGLYLTGNLFGDSTIVGDSTYYVSGFSDGLLLSITGAKDTCVRMVNQYKEQDLSIHVSVFPNPSNGNFTLDFGEFVTEVKVKIYSLDGKMVYMNEKKRASRMVINSQLTRGIFLAHISFGNQHVYKKLVVY